MKKQIVILAISLLLLGAVSTFAEEEKSNGVSYLTEEEIDNYVTGIHSNNLGLRVSCAYFLGEYKVSEAIIPLMKMLNSEKSEEGRIIAALSLIKIGTGKAVYAVKQAANLDRSERVRNLCEKFYNSFAYAENEQKESF
jgi:hypothetical protein